MNEWILPKYFIQVCSFQMTNLMTKFFFIFFYLLDSLII